MYGFIEVTDNSKTIAIAISQIQTVSPLQGQSGTMIVCGDSTYNVSENYDTIMKMIRAEIIWVLRNTKGGTENE